MYNYQKYEDLWHSPLSDYSRLLEPWLKSYFKGFNQSNILEIGFGSGHPALILANQDFSGTYFGVDIDPNAAIFAKNLLKDNPNHSYFSFETAQADNSNLVSKTFDVAIFCLSACEMSDSQISDYLSCIKAKKLVIINPSTLTQYFQTKITKSWLTKFTSRFGQAPKWLLQGEIPQITQDFNHRKLAGNQDLKIPMIYRSLGDTLNICKKHNWNFKKYTDLKYNISDIKTAPVSKFEVLEFEKGLGV